jgi:hypothetical protein
MKRLGLLAFAVLAACGTPQQQCINYNTRDLRTMDRLIAETEGNLERGYAIETITVYEEYYDVCYEYYGETIVPRLCYEDYPILVDRPKAIDLNDEAKKLESLKVKRKDLARKAELVIAQCQAKYPE